MTLGLICARGGSKGVPGKNLRVLAGHPLIAYTIAVARACPFIDRLIVSTDSPMIAEAARRYGAEVPFVRPAALASDESGKIPVLQHAVTEIERGSGPVELVVDLDPTCPLREVEDVARCWRLVQEPETDVVFTATPARKNPYFNMVEVVGGYARLAKPSISGFVRRQDAPPVYEMNASVYAWHRNHLLNDGRVLGVRSRMVEMPPERSHDIDHELDFAFLEFLIATGRERLLDPQPQVR